MEIPLTDFKDHAYEYLDNLKEPIVVTKFKRKIAIVTAYSPEEEMYQEAVAGNITWEDYRTKLLRVGYEQLTKNPSKVNPAHVINAESVENDKTRTRLQEIGLRMVAAKLFIGILKPAKCPNCQTQFIPEGGVEIDDKYLRPQLPDSISEEHRAISKGLPGA